MSFDELVISLDRLSRFKLPDEVYNRVFYSIISKHLIYPKYSKQDFFCENEHKISKIVKKIWNESVKKNCGYLNKNYASNNALRYFIRNTFKNIDLKTSVFINTKLEFSSILDKIDYKTASLNLKFLIKANELKDKLSYEKMREEYELCFPISKILIVEGVTEEILLPIFSKKINKSFNKNGIYIIGAGGKSKSSSLYLMLKNKIKLPIILLFDLDATEICKNLSYNLQKKDKYILIEQGEFEDIIPLYLIKRSLNKEYSPASPLCIKDLKVSNKMCKNIETFYRTRNLGEFKKSKFAKIIASNVKYKTDISDLIKKIILCII